MNFTNEQKLMCAMLAEIHLAVGCKGGVDSKLVSEALWNDNTWAIPWSHPFLLDQVESPEHVRHVVDVLDMWSFIETGYHALSNPEKDGLKSVFPWGEPKFSGFDGNNESRQLSAASFLIEQLGRFTHFKGRELDSHSPTIERDRRMLSVFLPIRAELGQRDHPRLNMQDLEQVLGAATS